MPTLPQDAAVHPDLARASTPPSSAYLDPAVHRAERDRIFARTWQFAARLDQLGRPGDYAAAEVAGEPVVLTRGRDGALRALSNVCRHRAAVVAQGCGNARTLRCPYHAWTYGLDGGLLGAPEFDGVQGWDKAAVRLPAFEVEAWGPLAFVRLSPGGPPLKRVLGRIPEEIASQGYRLEEYRFLTRTEYLIDCNWKVYVDNYLEGYHIPNVHPALFRELDYKSYRVETFEHYSAQHSPLRPVDGARGKRRAAAAARRFDPAKDPKPLYYWLFPNFMLNVYPDNLHTTVVVPLGPQKTLTFFDWFVPAGRSRGGRRPSVGRAIAFNDRVQKEDLRICESVQRGLRSRLYDRGRYCVRRENGVHHFHRLWQGFLAPG